jgi:hypothetical protein
MADLIAKVSRMDSNRNDSSSHPSHLRSQDTPHLRSGHQIHAHDLNQNKVVTEAYHSPPDPSRASQYNPSSSSAVELDDFGNGGRRNGGGNGNGAFEINVKSEVQLYVEERSVAGSTMDGSLGGMGMGMGMEAQEEDMKPLREEDKERDARERL